MRPASIRASISGVIANRFAATFFAMGILALIVATSRRGLLGFREKARANLECFFEAGVETTSTGGTKPSGRGGPITSGRGGTVKRVSNRAGLASGICASSVEEAGAAFKTSFPTCGERNFVITAKQSTLVTTIVFKKAEFGGFFCKAFTRPYGKTKEVGSLSV